MNRTAPIHRAESLVLSVAIAFAGMFAAAASGQALLPNTDAKSGSSTEKSTADAARPLGNVKFYVLQHADPNFVAEVLHEMLQTSLADGTMRLAVDSRTSALIVSAPQEVQKKVAELVKNIDALPKPEENMKLFTLVNADPESAAKVLRTMLPKVRFATEPQTRSLIGKGPIDDLQVAEAVVTKLDESQADYAASYKVRFVWLANGLPLKDEGAPPADDLKDVVDELSQQGVKDLRQIGELAVQTTLVRNSGANFQIKASPRCFNETVEFSASGILSKMPLRGLLMNIRIGTRNESSSPNHNLREIETQIALPEKQYVVLAVVLSGKQTSVFVVQVVGIAKPGEKKDGKPGQNPPRR